MRLRITSTQPNNPRCANLARWLQILGHEVDCADLLDAIVHEEGPSKPMRERDVLWRRAVLDVCDTDTAVRILEKFGDLEAAHSMGELAT